MRIGGTTRADWRFFGRRADIERLRALFGGGARLVSLTGPGGMGKTSLSLRFAEEERETSGADEGGGAWFCDASEARTLDALCAAVVTALGISAGATAATASAVLGRIGETLAGRGPLLLVLDNCEQVTEGAARAVRAFIDAAPELRVLVTSRERLGLSDEHAVELGPLELPAAGGDALGSDAVQLFAERAARARPDFELGAAEAPLVAEIVRRLDGMPLAIELAAARASLLGTGEILARLDQRFELLGGSRRDVSERQRTLRRAIEWSWDLLTPAEQSAFAQSGVFHGGFTLRAAERVVDLSAHADAPSVIDVLQALLDKSLLRSLEARRPGGERRLGMYESLAELAREKLQGSTERALAERRHTECFVGAAPSATASNEPLSLAVELENLRAVHRREIGSQRADAHDDAARAALAISRVLSLTGPLEGHLELLDRTLDAPGIAEPLIAELRVARGEARSSAARLDEARADLEQALAHAVSVGDERIRGRALSALGVVDWRSGLHDRAEAALADALGAARAARDVPNEAVTLRRMANLLLDRGRAEQARGFVDRALGLGGDGIEPSERALALATLAWLLFQGGRHDEARTRQLEALGVFESIGDQQRSATALANLGVFAQELGRVEEARSAFSRAMRGARHVGDRRLLGWATGALGRLHHGEGDLERASERFAEAIGALEGCGASLQAAVYRAALGAVLAARGRTDDALSALETADRELAHADPQLRTTLALYRGVVERALAVQAAARADSAEESRLLDAARARLAAASGENARSDDVRFARRVLERALGATPSAPSGRPPAPLVVAKSGAWFRLPDGTRVEIVRRRSLRLVLSALARRRATDAGTAIDVEALVREGWPGERMLASAGATRAYATVARLRKLGLGELLLKRSNGYLLDPRVELVIDESGADPA